MNILLTGASRGLGVAIADRLLAAGNCLWLPVRQENSQLEQWRRRFPGQVHSFSCDLTVVETLRGLLTEHLTGQRVVLDGVVNNAAVAYDDLVSNLDLDQLGEMFRVNVYSPMEITRFAIRNFLLHRTRGSIVHVSSICSHTGYKGLAMYGATKGAIESFSRGVAREWGSKGIRSNCVVPGFMETDMSAVLGTEQRNKIFQRTSLKQATAADSVAATVCFLLGPESNSVTGQNFVVDSGAL